MAGRALCHRPRDRGRLLLRLRAARVPLAGRPGAHRGPHAGDRREGAAVRARGALARGGARAVRGPALQARDRGGGRGRGGRARRPVLGLLQQRVGGSVPRPARAVDRPAGCLQAPVGRRGVLARRRDPPPAPAGLRHRVGDPAGPRRLPGAAGGSGTPRPPEARPPARSVLLARRARAGSVDLASARRRVPQAARGLRAEPAPRARLRPGRHTAHRALGALGDLRTPGEVRGQHVPADEGRVDATTTSSR